MQNDECVIFVYSCYRNRKMWDIFACFFKKYWYDRPYKICLLTDDYKEELPGFFDEVVVCDSNWITMMQAGIAKMKDPQYFILLMDDYFMTSKVDNDQVEKYIQLAKKYDCMNIRLNKTSFTEKNKRKDRSDLVDIVAGSAYSISLQAGIWNTKYFLEFVENDWTPWDFERIGSLRNDVIHPVMESFGWYLPYLEAVRNGKWMLNGYDLCKRNGITDLGFKDKMSMLDVFISELKAVILSIAPKTVLRIQNKVTRR